MKINQSDFYDMVETWLVDMGYTPCRMEDRNGIYYWLETADGNLQARIIVEGSEDPPITVHFYGRLQLIIVKQNLLVVALRLMHINRNIRFGQFILAANDGIINYRLTHVLTGDQNPFHQFSFCMRQVIWYAETYGPRIRELHRHPPDLDEQIMLWKIAESGQWDEFVL